MFSSELFSIRIKKIWKTKGIGSAEGALQELEVPVRNGPLLASGLLATSRREATDGASTHCWPLQAVDSHWPSWSKS